MKHNLILSSSLFFCFPVYFFYFNHIVDDFRKKFILGYKSEANSDVIYSIFVSNRKQT